MGTIADDRDLQFDERIILLFSDEMWQELSETFGMENDSPAERLLELLSRQVWAFIEEGKIYLTTRSVVLCGEVVALHRGDFGFEVRNVIPTTQSYVTQAFRFGVKVDADWELITPQRGLPFPTTKGAYKLLNALLLDDMERPPIKSVSPCWNAEKLSSAQTTEEPVAPPSTASLQPEAKTDEAVPEGEPVVEPVVSITEEPLAAEVEIDTKQAEPVVMQPAKEEQPQPLEEEKQLKKETQVEEDRQGLVDSWISRILHTQASSSTSANETSQVQEEQSATTTKETPVEIEVKDSSKVDKEEESKQDVESWLSLLLHAQSVDLPVAPENETEHQEEQTIVAEEAAVIEEETEAIPITLEEDTANEEETIILNEQEIVDEKAKGEPYEEIAAENISLIIDEEEEQKTESLAETNIPVEQESSADISQKPMDVDSFIQQILQAKTKKTSAVQGVSAEQNVSAEELSSAAPVLEEGEKEPAATYSAATDSSEPSVEAKAKKGSVESWLDMIIKSKPAENEITFTVSSSDMLNVPAGETETVAPEIDLTGASAAEDEVKSDDEADVNFWAFDIAKDKEKEEAPVDKVTKESETPEGISPMATETTPTAQVSPTPSGEAAVDKQSAVDSWIELAKQKQAEESGLPSSESVTLGSGTENASVASTGEDIVAGSLETAPAGFAEDEDVDTVQAIDDQGVLPVQGEDDGEFRIITNLQEEFTTNIAQDGSFRDVEPAQEEPPVDIIKHTPVDLPEEINVVKSVFGLSISDYLSSPTSDETAKFLDILMPAGTAMQQRIGEWAETPDWATLPNSTMMRIACILPNAALARQYWNIVSGSTKARVVLVENGTIAEQKDGLTENSVKELWTARYRQSRLAWESESTRLRMLRSQSNVIDKYFREYFDYQDELARLESEAENQTIFAQVEESPTVKRIRQELMAIIAKQKRIEEKLTKLVNSAKGMKGILTPKYLNLQEEYRLLLQQASLKSQELAQYTGDAADNSSGEQKVYNQQYEQKRSQILQEISAIERFINESYGKQFKGDPAWQYFETKDIEGLRRTLDERIKNHQTQEKALSNWQNCLEKDFAPFSPQIWVLSQEDISFLAAEKFYPHLFIVFANVTLEPGELTEKTWAIASQDENGFWKFAAGELKPPVEPYLFLNVFDANEQCRELAQIIWNEQELSSFRED